MTGEQSVIEISELCKTFTIGIRGLKFQALQGVDLKVQPGSSFGFLGPNGAGKTTTIKILAGLIFQTSGKATIFGGSPSVPQVRRRLGYLPENPAFHDHLTAREVLGFACELHQYPRASRRSRIAEMLDIVKLSHAADTAVRRFSKGMVQRLGIAQACIHDPELIILDEPMSGLDPIGRRDMKELMLDLSRRKKTLFFSTHIISDVEEICDEAAIVIGGRIVRSGSVKEMLSSEAREVEVLAVDVPPAFEDPSAVQHGSAVAFTAADHQAARELVERLWSQGARVMSMKVKKYGLESVFMQEVAKRPPQAKLED
jgi:ABC-2 type transport system ATP-binding protein